MKDMSAEEEFFIGRVTKDEVKTLILHYLESAFMMELIYHLRRTKEKWLLDERQQYWNRIDELVDLGGISNEAMKALKTEIYGTDEELAKYFAEIETCKEKNIYPCLDYDMWKKDRATLSDDLHVDDAMH